MRRERKFQRNISGYFAKLEPSVSPVWFRGQQYEVTTLYRREQRPNEVVASILYKDTRIFDGDFIVIDPDTDQFIEVISLLVFQLGSIWNEIIVTEDFDLDFDYKS